MSRSTFVMLGLVLWALSCSADGQAETADAAPFLTLARDAVGGADALAEVRGLSVSVNIQQSSGGGLPQQDDGRASNYTVLRIWLDPPFRFLETITPGHGVPMRRGVDHDRLLPRAIEDPTRLFGLRGSLRRFALALLLVDPQSLQVTMSDEGDATMEGKRVHVLQATDEAGFDLVMYFDQQSHRLLATDDSIFGSHGAVHISNGQVVSSWMSDPKAMVERYTYGMFRRVGKVDLPFSLTRQLFSSKAGVDVYHVTKYELNPKDLDKEFAR